MVTTYILQVQDPGGYNLQITFQTDQDFESFIEKFKAQADQYGFELILKKKAGAGERKQDLVVKL